jgi:HAD superfamily hydrolase (TIGR01549 family)
VKFEAIYLDLYNTLIHFDSSILPEVEFKGQTLPTTSVEIHRQVEKKLNIRVPYQRFLQEFLESLEVIIQIRGKEYQEVSCLERFRIVCKGLEIDTQAAVWMIQVHMDELFRTMYCPEKTKSVLGRLSDIPLVLVSNFDHAPTVRRALGSFGLAEYFSDIFISDEVGWRKPGKKFFEMVLGKTRHDPEQCLYVGDDVVDDLLGATREGFQVAWLVEQSQAEKPPHEPRWVIRDLEEVMAIVEGAS